jgi:hypothetical protein
MGSLRAKLIDRNRYAKRYPLIRAPIRTTYMGDSDLAMEVGSIYFNNTDTGTLVYDAQFLDTSYQVIAVARSAGIETADVNVFVTNKDTSSVTVQASSNFTGYVDIFAVRIA